jgi:hypothetical protein
MLYAFSVFSLNLIFQFLVSIFCQIVAKNTSKSDTLCNIS